MPERRDGDWDCPECGALCFASKETCFKCDQKSGGGSGAPERRAGDWDCPDCGAVCFASKETCFKCDRKAAGGGGGGDSRPGDWKCPDCGTMCFASKETCFKCDRGGGAAGGGRARKDGDWDCPDCGSLVFADKDTCFKCDRAPAAPAKGKGKSGAKTAAVPSATAMAAPSDPIRALAKQSPAFKKAWVAYCKWFELGSADPTKCGDDFISGFVDWTAELISTEIAKDAPEEAVAAPQKRPAASATAGEPAAKAAKVATAAAAPATDDKKKVTMKKPVADEIKRLNAAGGLLAPLRLGAVARSLGELDVANALQVLAKLEEEQSGVEDPNEFVTNCVNLALAEA